MDLTRFFVKDVIVHELPKKKAGEANHGDLELSQIAAPTDDVVRNFFRERIAETIKKHGDDVEVDETQTSTVPTVVKRFLEGCIDLVQMSQDFARSLYAQQTAVQPEGLLVVTPAALEGAPALAVLKLQKQEGARVLHQVHEGQTTLNVEHLRELMLTETTRVFKAGVFRLGEEGQLLGKVSDEQVREQAQFFLGRFLGCRLSRRGDVVTRDFHTLASRFIDDQVTDPQTKVRYHIALQAELNSNRDTIRPRDWITDNLDEEHRQPCEVTLAEGRVPLDTFPKDTRRLKPKDLSQTRAVTEHGLQVSGATTVFDELVKPDTQDGREVLIIEDRIASVK